MSEYLKNGNYSKEQYENDERLQQKREQFSAPEPEQNQQKNTRIAEKPVGVFLKKPSNYIVVVRRSGEIFDVWKLEDSIIAYNETTKGWEISTNKGASFFVSGDVEIWRIDSKDSQVWNVYKSYHKHIAEQSYEELFLNPDEQADDEPERGLLGRIFGRKK